MFLYVGALETLDADREFRDLGSLLKHELFNARDVCSNLHSSVGSQRSSELAIVPRY